MICGIGIDVVDVARFERTLTRTPRLRERLFTPGEQQLSMRSLAARFAAKEALAKSLGAPPGMAWTDAEVTKDASGAVQLVTQGGVQQVAQARGVRRFHLSLSHDGGIATAMVVAEGDPAWPS